LVLAFTLWSFQYACKPSGEKEAKLEKLTLACTTNPASALVHIAAKKDFFRQAGLDVTATPYEFGKLALDAVINGQADMATAADTPVMYAILDGKTITAFAVIETSTENQVIVARKDRGIQTVGDLKGKTIGVTKGTAGDFFTDSILLLQNIGKDQVSIVNLMPSEMPDAILTGKVDAVSIWNPTAAQIQKSLGDSGIVFVGDSVYTESFCLLSMKDYALNHPATVRKVLQALNIAQSFVNQHPDEARQIVSDFCMMDVTILDDIWKFYSFRVTLDQTLIVNLENQTRWAIKNDLIHRKDMPNYLDFISPEILQSVKPEAVRIIR
jgi:NitT/TauT family transport system substrate-binding protein